MTVAAALVPPMKVGRRKASNAARGPTLSGSSMIVATAGTFDLFHAGHANLLRRCRWLAGEDGEVVVILNLDEFVEAYKGRRPVVAYQDRAAVLRALRDVDVVVPNVG